MNRYLIGFFLIIFSSTSYGEVLCKTTNIESLEKLEAAQKCIISEIDKLHDLYKDTENYNKCKSKLAQMMKANIAKQFFGLNGFFKVMYEDDKMIKKALDTMK